MSYRFHIWKKQYFMNNTFGGAEMVLETKRVPIYIKNENRKQKIKAKVVSDTRHAPYLLMKNHGITSDKK